MRHMIQVQISYDSLYAYVETPTKGTDSTPQRLGTLGILKYLYESYGQTVLRDVTRILRFLVHLLYKNEI